MVLFILMLSVLGLLSVVAPIRRRLSFDRRARWALALGLLFPGVLHFADAARFLAMMPAYLPYPLELVYFTGALEIGFALLLLTPRARPILGWLIALFFLAVFPANVENALSVGGWYYWLRLGFQPLFILWALACCRSIPLPAPGRAAASPASRE